MRTLHFGPVKLGWRFDEGDPAWAGFLAGYAPYLDGAPAAATVTATVLEVPAGEQRPRLPNSFIRRRRLRKEGFELGDGLVRGRRDGPDGIECEIHPVLLHGTGLRVLEQFFYLLFHHFTLAGAAEERLAPFLLHSSGVLDRGRVHAFCGPTGAGKSTAAALCPARPKLTDECLICRQEDGRWILAGSPINPFFREKEPGEGPLAGIYLIEHGPRHALVDVSRRDAVPRLVAEVVAPLGLWELDLALAMRRALDRALRLAASGAVRVLRFTPDPGFWELLGRDESRADGETDA